MRDLATSRPLAGVVLSLLLLSLLAYECARLAPSYVAVGRVISVGRWVLLAVFVGLVTVRFVELRA